MHRTRLSLWIFVLFVLLPAVGAAETTYSYTGANYTFITGARPNASIRGVQGTFTMPSPIAPGRHLDIRAQVTNFSFSDGVKTRDESNSHLCLFQVFVNDAGVIDSWTMAFTESPIPAAGRPQHFILTQGGAGNSGGDWTGFLPSIGSDCRFDLEPQQAKPAAIAVDRGEWTMSGGRLVPANLSTRAR